LPLVGRSNVALNVTVGPASTTGLFGDGDELDEQAAKRTRGTSDTEADRLARIVRRSGIEVYWRRRAQ
jgi:hypothetical protein